MAAAFNLQTHMLTARVAYEILKQEDPAALSKAEALLNQYADAVTEENEGDYKFVEGIVWGDMSKRRGGGW